MGKLEGKTALITGGTSGIGAATSRLFAKEGARVIIAGRNKDRGEKLVDEIGSPGGSGAGELYTCDMTKNGEIEKLSEYICAKYGKLDILFNNMGTFVLDQLENMSEEEWDLVFHTNLKSVMFLTKYLMPLLEKSRGTVINNSSINGLQSYVAGRSTYMYAASKDALVKFSQLCALNYAKTVRVNCICPGIIDTPIYTNRDFSRFDGTIPMERIGTADEVAKVVLFLASDDASYVTGAVIPVDGGAALM